ncbi:hypothetical protein DPEC_G00182300 [Dallia pectoralis]|uniref:Uncharacterized protein n=1 Tax=Dallia pectoralis TaxID=75939 RepID=A0ACC2GAE3_DALPE|nr:hypothetical protein DPEC_G00182300 [Dallia pectoralis]
MVSHALDVSARRFTSQSCRGLCGGQVPRDRTDRAQPSWFRKNPGLSRTRAFTPHVCDDSGTETSETTRGLTGIGGFISE